MNDQQQEQLEQFRKSANASFRRQIAQLSFNGAIVTGGLGLVSIDMAKAKMMVRRHAADPKPFCYINLPTKAGEDVSAALSKALMHPKLLGCGGKILDDVTATLWAYLNIRLLEKPVDMDRFKFSPEAAELFAEKFLK